MYYRSPKGEEDQKADPGRYHQSLKVVTILPFAEHETCTRSPTHRSANDDQWNIFTEHIHWTLDARKKRRERTIHERRSHKTEQLPQSTPTQELEDSELRSYPWMKSINFQRRNAPSHTQITSNNHTVTTKNTKKQKPTCGNSKFKNLHSTPLT